MDLEKLIKDFLEYLEIERNVSQLTIRNYAHYLYRFLAFLQKGAPSPASPETSSRGGPAITVKFITNDSIREYRLYLSRYVDDHGISLKRVTQNYHLIALRSFLKYCLKRDVAVVAPEKIDLPKAESRSIKFLEREQVERLLKIPSSLRDKAIMEVLFSTGLRVSELTKLNRDQINFDRREFGVIGKGRRARVVFLSDAAAGWVQKYLAGRSDSDTALFIRTSGKKDAPMRLTPRSVQRLVEKYVKRARLPVKITPHGLRHSFATDLLTGGADLRAIQEMLGHKNVSTTQIYTHITNPQLKEIHAKYHRK